MTTTTNPNTPTIPHPTHLTTATRTPVGIDPPPAHAGPVRTTARVAALELRLMLREPGTMVWLLAFPAITVLILAGVFGAEPDMEFAGMRPSEYYVVGYVGVVLAQLGLVTLPVHLASQRELGILRRYRSAGLGAGVVVASQAVVGLVLGLVGAAVVLAVGDAVYGVPAPADWPATAVWLAGGAACFVALGLALGTLLPSGRAANALGNLVFIPMFLLGGGGPPRDVMTDAMRAVSDALPLTHVIGGLREAWLGAGAGPRTLWWPAAVAAVAVVIAVRTARRRAG